jgi:hypothetical protein
MGVFIYLINMVLTYPSNRSTAFAGLFFKLVATISTGGLVYIGMLYILKTEELIYAAKLIGHKFRSTGKLT